MILFAVSLGRFLDKIQDGRRYHGNRGPPPPQTMFSTLPHGGLTL